MTTMAMPASEVLRTLMLCMACSTTWPRPPAPMKAAITTMLMASIVVWFIPARMAGRAWGRRTHRRVWRSVAPNISEASTVDCGTVRSPTSVSLTTGARANITVEEQHLGIHGQRPGQSHPLLHAAAELLGVMIAPALEADSLQELSGAILPLAAVHPLHLQPAGHVVHHRAMGEQPEVLEHHRHRRRRSRSVALSARVSSVPQTSTVPSVGSIRWETHRTKVDFPEPERPMTTNVSPGDTWKLTSRTATTLPTTVLISSLPAPASAISRARQPACRRPSTRPRP